MSDNELFDNITPCGIVWVTVCYLSITRSQSQPLIVLHH